MLAQAHPLPSTWKSSRNSPPNLSGSLDLWLCYLAFVDFALFTVTWLQGVLQSFPELETLQNSTGKPSGLSCPGQQGRHCSLCSFSSSKGILCWHSGITRSLPGASHEIGKALGTRPWWHFTEPCNSLGWKGPQIPSCSCWNLSTLPGYSKPHPTAKPAPSTARTIPSEQTVPCST